MNRDLKPTAYQREQAGVDAGLRAHMVRIYNLMALALALTGATAYVTSTSETLMSALFGTPLSWVVMLAPLGLVLYLSFRIRQLSASTAQTLFWVYAASLGLSLSYIFLAYTSTSIARTFFVTAGTFGAMSLWGYTTKKDLSGMGSFLLMGVVGILIASIVNIFLKSTGLQFAISIIGVLVFTGLTAYDTQKIKLMYYESDGHEVASKKAILGALTLYLDFINLFLFLLRFLGDRRN